MKVCRLLLGFAAVIAPLARARAVEGGHGANMPWTTYEAENSRTNGTILGPDYTGNTPQREASRRQCVRLDSTGQFVEFTAKADADGIVVRYCIPDSADGRGIDATLSLYINRQPRNTLAMTSRYAYLYGNFPFSNNPSAGMPRCFWDEARFMPGAIHRGDVIRLQKNVMDKAAWYLIDFVDLEPVAPAMQKPKNGISVSEFGAKGNGHGDDRPAFLAAIAAAKAQHKSVWIPPGQFVIQGTIELSDVVMRGAGMWYSTLIGSPDYQPMNRIRIDGEGSNITLSDFALAGNLNYRNDSEANDGLDGSFGTGSVIRNIWVEHTKTGAWLTNSDGLLVEDCRFRNTIADGINLCLGIRNTTVRNCTARGNGDDCFAIWPAVYQASEFAAGHNHIVDCTAQLPFLAQAFSIYGGDANTIENCRAIDIPYGAGLLASTMFPSEFGFRGITAYRHITMIRAGDRDGAIGVMTNLRMLAGLQFDDIDVIDSPTDGIKFTCVAGRAVADTKFDHIRIINPGLSGRGCGIVEARGAVGSATISNVTVIHPKTRAWQNNASAFNLIRGPGDAGVDDRFHSGATYSIAQIDSPEP